MFMNVGYRLSVSKGTVLCPRSGVPRNGANRFWARALLARGNTYAHVARTAEDGASGCKWWIRVAPERRPAHALTS